jgi:hypothetical protein
VHEDDSTVLVDFSGGVVSLEHDISGKKSDFGSNTDLFVAICFSGSEMLEFEGLVKLENWIVDISFVDADNCPFFGFSTIETGRSNGDLFACNPIDCHRESNRSGSDFRGGVHSSPGWNSNGTMHI